VTDRATLERKLVELHRQIGLNQGLRQFIKICWSQTNPGDQFKDGWSIGAVCEHLEAVTAGQIRNLVINIPPGCMKSRTTGLFWPVWSWLRDPTKAWGSWSYDLALVLRESGAALDLIRSQWFRDRWPDKIIIQDRNPAVGEYWTTAGGLRFASTTPKGDATGWHFHYRIIDDPHKPQTISKVTLEESRRWWSETLPSRVKDAATAATVVVMQRLHEMDMAGLAEQDGNYVMLRIPMRYERSVYSLPSAPNPLNWKDPRQNEGELMWPERFPEWVVQSSEKKLGPSAWAAQYQQRPAPEGGATFRAEWFRTWHHKGSDTGHLRPGSFKELPEQFDAMIQSWDCSFKDKSTSDFVCGQVWGRKGMDFFILDERVERMDYSATCEAIREMTRKWPGARPILIEDKANGVAVISTMREELHGIQEVDPKGGKVSRANAVTGTYFAGNVYHPDPTTYTWVNDHRRELQTFPFGANDDRVDAMSQGLLHLMDQFRAFGEAMGEMAKVMAPVAEAGPVKIEDARNVQKALDLLFGPGRVL
jgi:predicted phage terminase large subunit-like protein